MPGPVEEAAGSTSVPDLQKYPMCPQLSLSHSMSLPCPLLHSALAGSLGSTAWSGVRRFGLVLASLSPALVFGESRV